MIAQIYTSIPVLALIAIMLAAASLMVSSATLNETQRATLARWMKTAAFSMFVIVLVLVAAIQVFNFLMGDGPPSRMEVFALVMSLANAYLWVNEWFKSRIAAIRAEALKELSDRLESMQKIE